MKTYSYEENKVITKKLIGIYNDENHTIDIDGEDKDIIKELKDFDGTSVEIVIKEKETTDLIEN